MSRRRCGSLVGDRVADDDFEWELVWPRGVSASPLYLQKCPKVGTGVLEKLWNIYELQKEYRRLVPVPMRAVDWSGKPHLPSFSTEESALEKISRSEMELKSWYFTWN